jgi:hypothetical protein
VGADIIGWRGCQLQDFLSPDGFLGKLKLRAYKNAVESQVDRDKWDTIQINAWVDRGNGPETRTLTYQGICSELQEFESGIPDCAHCPLSGGGHPVGCYRYVTYPLDAAFEESVFAFFTSQLSQPDSIASQIYQDIVSQVPSKDTEFHNRRGEGGDLAERPDVLTFEWSNEQGPHYVDSAMLMASLFITVEEPPVVVAYALFWTSFVNWLEGQNGSQTIREVRSVAELFMNTFEKSLTEGWAVLVDG